MTSHVLGPPPGIERWNGARYDASSQEGHYESWFVRANAARGGDAFWIRYTIFSPRGRPQDAVGELWAIWFADGGIVVVREEHPMARCSFARDRLDAAVGDATLDSASLHGRVGATVHTIEWDLHYRCDQPPLLLLPERLYEARLPRAKAVVNQPLAVFDGWLEVDGVPIEIRDWVGSQNHNWGSRHTDRYAWGQVAGFDEAPDAFLECSTARLKIAGPLWIPPLSPAVVRLHGETFAFNALAVSARANARYAPYHWRLTSRDRDRKLTIDIEGQPKDFVALDYRNPPGGTKTCLNSKVARCRMTLEIAGRPATTLHSSRAAFEILDDARPAGASTVA